MSYGYVGSILRVNLTDGSIRVETPSDSQFRKYVGGRNWVAHYLLREVPPRVDALDARNKLILATGVLTGVPVGCTGRNTVGAKSPLTGGYGESEAGGFFGAELKFAGFDAIIVEGMAREPLYLWIHDGEAELRDASRLWGSDIAEGERRIREELGDPLIRTAQIGPAGENLVRYATIANDIVHVYGRTGMGAVMGSKKLRAIAARGHGKVAVADAEAVKAFGRRFAETWRDSCGRLYDVGTMGSVAALSKIGGLPTRNFQAGSMVGAERISGQVLRDTFLVAREGCYACGVNCKRVAEVQDPQYPYVVERAYGGPEYETAAALGSCCGVDDLVALLKASELCNRYGVDTISAGVAIAWAMECFERGILQPSEVDGLDLHFGNGAAVVALVEKIAHRDGFGALLAEGVARAAEQTGRGAAEFAMHVKGLELPMHEPRLRHGQGLGYIVSPTGADHCHNIWDEMYSSSEGGAFDRIRALGVLEGLPATDLSPSKVRLFFYDVMWYSLANCLELCLNSPHMGNLNQLTDLVRAVTGWNTSLWELGKVAERSLTLPQLFNVRAGLTPEQDRLPARLFEAPSPGSTAKAIDPVQLESAKRLYYAMCGWDPLDGVPTYAKLIELGLGEFASP